MPLIRRASDRQIPCPQPPPQWFPLSLPSFPNSLSVFFGRGVTKKSIQPERRLFPLFPTAYFHGENILNLGYNDVTTMLTDRGFLNVTVFAIGTGIGDPISNPCTKLTFFHKTELPWPENAANTCTWHTETLDSCFDLIRSHQQYIPWSPPLEIEPTTTECKAETLSLIHQPTSHTSGPKLTSHVNYIAN